MAAMDCAMRDLPPMVAMAFPNRAHLHNSESVQSFEERYPGVWIRKKKKREGRGDLPRTSSTNSMDSWCSDLDNLPQASSLQSTVYEPNEPTEPTSESLQSTVYEPHLDSLQSTLYEPHQESLQGSIYEPPSDPGHHHHHGGHHGNHHDPRKLGEQLMARLEHGTLGRRGTSPPRSFHGKTGFEELHIDSHKLKAHGMQAIPGLYEGHPAVLHASAMGTARRHRLVAHPAHGTRLSDHAASPSYASHDRQFSDASSSPQRFVPPTPPRPHVEDSGRAGPPPPPPPMPPAHSSPAAPLRPGHLPTVPYSAPAQPPPQPQAHQPYAQHSHQHQHQHQHPAPRPFPLTQGLPSQQSHRLDPYDPQTQQSYQHNPTSPQYGFPAAQGPQISPLHSPAAAVEHLSYAPTAQPPTPTGGPAGYPSFSSYPSPSGQPMTGTASPPLTLVPARPRPTLAATPPAHGPPSVTPGLPPPPHIPSPPLPSGAAAPTVDLANAAIQSSVMLGRAGGLPSSSGTLGTVGTDMDVMSMMHQAVSSLPGTAVQHAATAAAAGLAAAGLPHMDVTTFTEQQRAALGLLSVIGEKKGADDKAAVDPRKYKTRMCRNWEETGGCPYEHTCCFAHGPAELRNVADNHKLLASIGYFSNVILLAMTNGQKPALPPHCLYQQPSMFKPPETAEELKQCTTSLPPGVSFPFQEPLPSALRALKGDGAAAPAEGAPAGKRRRRRRGRRHRKRAAAAGGDADGGKGEEEEGEEDDGDGDDDPEDEAPVPNA